jgi:hypothetical protein
MAILTVAGITVPFASGSEIAGEEGGTPWRAWAGNLRNSGPRWIKRNWQFDLGEMTQTEYGTLRTAVLAGNVVCAGDALGASFTCRVRLEDVDFGANGFSFLRKGRLTLREV